jgi:hypothetical protein
MGSTDSCIFCQSSSNMETVEHIVPRSLGNLHYILPKGTVCHNCNNKFAWFENRVLSSTTFLSERRRFNLLRKRNQNQGNPLEDQDLKKFLLKMAFESLFKSKRRIWAQHDFTELLDFLIQGKESAIFTAPESVKALAFKPIPGWIERFRLRNNRIHLDYAEDGTRLYFQFQFGQLRSRLRID